MIYNCFYYLILCYLPCTCHLKRTFDKFCSMLNLDVDSKTRGDLGTIYKKYVLLFPIGMP